MADEPTTYIKLDRKILVWEWYHDAVVKSLFIHLLLTVFHEDRHFKGRFIKRGQCVTSISLLSEGSGLSFKQVRNALTKLKQTGEILVESSPAGTLITIPKYDLYQKGKQGARSGQGEGKAGANPYYKKQKKEEKEKNESPPGDEETEWIFQ